MIAALKPGETLVIATHNSGKLKEFEELLKPYGLTVLAAGALGVQEPEETGTTFVENARIKALASAQVTQKLALADDSGLEIDALDGAPGIYSARWAGEARDFHKAMRLVEQELQAVGATTPEKRRARFICALCLVAPDGQSQIFEGSIEGHVIWPPRGNNGFGYDPMFLPEGEALTFGEMTSAQKHALSHRAKAFAAFTAALVKPGA